MKKTIKLIGTIIGSLLALIVAAAIILPIIYEDDIKELVENEVNKRIDAKFSFNDFSLSLWRSLPDFRIRLEKVQIDGIETFQNQRLFYSEEIQLDLDFASIIRDRQNININEINLTNPSILLLVNTEGQANWDIYIDSKSTENGDSDPIHFALDDIEISDAEFGYHDMTSDMHLVFKEGFLNSSGNYNATSFNLNNEVDIGSLDFTSDQVKYFNGASLQGNADILVDFVNSKYTFTENQLSLNALPIAFDGFVQNKPASIAMDLGFETPSKDLRTIISLIPALYTDSFKDISTAGQISLAGKIVGEVNSEAGTFPKINLKLNVGNGRFQYPSLPLPVEQIDADIVISSQDNRLESFLVDMPVFGFSIQDQNVEGRLKMDYNPILSTYAGSLKGNLNLESISKAIPVESLDNMSGVVKSDIAFDFNSEQLSKSNYKDMELSGEFEGNALNINHQSYPSIQVESVRATLSPEQINTELGNVQVGRSNVEQGQIDILNPLGFLADDQKVSTNILVKGDNFYVDEWMPDTSTTTAIPDSFSISKDVIPTYLSSTMKIEFENIFYADYQVEDFIAQGNYNEDQFTVNNLMGKMADSDWDIKGTVYNINGWLKEEKSLTGDLKFNSDQFIVDNWIPISEDDVAEKDSSLRPIVRILPADMDMSIASSIGRMRYGNSTWRGLKGTINLVDQALEFHEVTSELMGGRMQFDGLYDETTPNPSFSIKYDAKNMKFKEMFDSFLAMKKLAPIAKYIEGVFNTSLVFEGELSDGYIPVWDKLNAAGFLETLEGTIRDFKPLDVIGEKLQIKEFKNMTIDDSKNWFEVVEGKVKVEEFKRKMDDIDLSISGNHAIDNELDYSIFARVPRSKFEANQVGGKVNEGLDWLKNEASRLGIDANAGDFVNLEIRLSGHILDPKVDIRLVDVSGKSLDEAIKDKIQEEATALKDSVQQEAEKKVEEVKDSVQTRIEEETEILKDKAEEKTKEVTDSVKTIIKEKATKTIDSLGKVKVDSLIDTLIGKDKVEKVEEVIEKRS